MTHFFKINARAFLIVFLLLAIGAFAWRYFKEEDVKAFSVTGIHRAITQEDAWLNVARPLTPEDLKGRILLLDFWTFCCINCIHVMPDLKTLEEKFGHALSVIGVHSAKFANERDSANIRNAILRYDLEHPVVNDAEFNIWKSFNVRAWPTLVLVNPEGKIEKTYSGEGHREELERDIAMLKKKYDGVLVTDALPLALEKDKAPTGALSFPGKIIYAENFSGMNALFVSDSAHHRVLALSVDGTILEAIGSGEAGLSDGAFDTARFNAPQGMAYHDGVLYVADTNNHVIRAVDFKTRSVATIAGTGTQGYVREAKDSPALETPLASPWDVALWPDVHHLTIAMAGTHQLWQYDIENKTLSVMAGNGRESIDDGAYPDNSLSQPSGLAPLDKTLYFVDAETSSLRKLEGGAITTLIGTGLFDFGLKDGARDVARMQHTIGVGADKSGVYLADSYNHAIRTFDPKSGELTTLAGNGEAGFKDGSFADARFNEPNDVEKVGDTLYVADTNNSVIRVMDLKTKTVRTLDIASPMSESSAQFSDTLPNLIALDAQAFTHLAPGKEIAVTLKLAPGWKINTEAPSAGALFVMGESPEALASFDLEAIKTQRLTLPPLEAGKDYRLQATLYYCEKEEGSQCLIGSVDIPLSAGGDTTEIVLPIN